MRALCHVQNEATSVNSRVLRRGQFSRGLSIVPLAGYNCLSNLRPWGEFALSISRGSPALHTVPETIDRCIRKTIAFRYPVSESLDYTNFQKQEGNKSLLFLKRIAYCSDTPENGTSPVVLYGSTPPGTVHYSVQILSFYFKI